MLIKGEFDWKSSGDICSWIPFLSFCFGGWGGGCETGFNRHFLRTTVLHAHSQLPKRRPLFMRIVLQSHFRIFQSNGKKENLWNLDLNLFIEIHHEDGFLGGEISFRIRVRLQKPKSEFLNRGTQPEIWSPQLQHVTNNSEPQLHSNSWPLH